MIPELALRILILLFAGIIIATGIRLGYLLHSRWDLPPRKQWLRYPGALIAGLGLWVGLGAFQHAPAEGELACTEDLALAREEAAAAQVPLLIDFTADWCAACHELRERTLNAPEVLQESERFVCAVVDVTEETPTNRALMDEYNVGGLPHLAWLDGQGELRANAAIRGFVESDAFLDVLERVEQGLEGAGSRFQQTLDERGWFWALLLVFLGGIATSLTPCVYPLIPVTVGVFGATKTDSRLHALLLSLTYVGGMVVTYTALGVVAAMTGGLFGAALQSPWVIGGIALLFVALSFSMLGLFELRLPASLQNRLSNAGRSGWTGALVMGLVAGLIAAPCVGPVLAGVLLFVAENREPLIGAVLLSTFALGMGVLFIVIGTFSGLVQRMPTSGTWMEVVKAVFAIIFIALAVFYLAPHFPFFAELQDAPWSLLAR